MSQDYYQVLELPSTALAEDIRQAFRRLARIYHPDVAETGSVAQFQRLNAAYQTLSDPEQRRVYDAQCSTPPTTDSPSTTTESSVVFRTTSPPAKPTTAELQPVRQALKRQLTRAIFLAEQLAEQFPGDPTARHLLALSYQRWGNALLQRGEQAQARTYLQRARATEPNNEALVFDVERDLARLR
ncbi:DnaJ domain-containing protein [Candidatus Cyanaurora vandensis]|uniref:J domain-containing protein n=1 Tax=Candidatus Cyanaurora vandensis TaxID=2714958 RepID=UPI00257AEA3F|nr:DnaJ domain-containing protein [Candidatus Cyanaurora vandensis]